MYVGFAIIWTYQTNALWQLQGSPDEINHQPFVYNVMGDSLVVENGPAHYGRWNLQALCVSTRNILIEHKKLTCANKQQATHKTTTKTKAKTCIGWQKRKHSPRIHAS